MVMNLLLHISWKAVTKMYWDGVEMEMEMECIHFLVNGKKINTDPDKRNKTWGVHTACIHKHQVRAMAAALNQYKLLWHILQKL